MEKSGNAQVGAQNAVNVQISTFVNVSLKLRLLLIGQRSVSYSWKLSNHFFLVAYATNVQVRPRVFAIHAISSVPFTLAMKECANTKLNSTVMAMSNHSMWPLHP